MRTGDVRLCYNRRGCGRLRRGQALLEYVLALVGVLIVVGVMAYFVMAARTQSERAADLMQSERI